RIEVARMTSGHEALSSRAIMRAQDVVSRRVGALGQPQVNMPSPTLEELPPPPAGRTGWPWTEGSPILPDVAPDERRWPRISVVTPSFNQSEYVEAAIRSVLLQGYPNLEVIVVDGGSSDGSVQTIAKYEKWLTRWTSERDGGPAQALNKGFKRAT